MQPDSLGKKIRRLRINNCLSQARLAEAVDVSTNYIGQIERGDRTPSLETTIALCNAHMIVGYIQLKGENAATKTLLAAKKEL